MGVLFVNRDCEGIDSPPAPRWFSARGPADAGRSKSAAKGSDSSDERLPRRQGALQPCA